MGTPAIVQGDMVTGSCPVHQIPNPASGVPQPSPAPMPFSAPLLQGLCMNVLIMGKPAAVLGSKGLNTPPHVGLHASDPFMVIQQEGMILGASPTVIFGGQPAAKPTPPPMMCMTPGSVTGTAVTVQVG